MKYCCHCGAGLLETAEYCEECGALVNTFPTLGNVAFCGNCGTKVSAFGKFCSQCGTPVDRTHTATTVKKTPQIKMSGVQTSLPEQSIYYYVHRFFPDAVNRYKTAKKVEVDIYIPSLKVGIEYDGYYWHKDKDIADILKNNALNKEDIFLIRVRDAGLPKLPRFNGQILEHGLGKLPGLHSNEYITEIIHLLSEMTSDELLSKALKEFSLSYEQYQMDIPCFLSNVYSGPVSDSAATSCASEYWDYEKNNGLKPEHYPRGSHQKVWFKCPNENSFLSFPVWIRGLCDSPKHECKKCELSICPFLGECDDKECDYIVREAKKIIAGKAPLPKSKAYLIDKLTDNPKTQELFNLRLNGERSTKWTKRFDKLFFGKSISDNKSFFPPSLAVGTGFADKNGTDLIKQFRAKYPKVNLQLKTDIVGLDAVSAEEKTQQKEKTGQRLGYSTVKEYVNPIIPKYEPQRKQDPNVKVYSTDINGNKRRIY